MCVAGWSGGGGFGRVCCGTGEQGKDLEPALQSQNRGRFVHPALVVRKPDAADQALQLGVLVLQALPYLAVAAPGDGVSDQVK